MDIISTIKSNSLYFENMEQYYPLIMGGIVVFCFFLYILLKPNKSKRSHTKQIHDLTEMMIRNKGTIQSFELMVGTLLKKMEKFEASLKSYDMELEKIAAMCKFLDEETSDGFESVYLQMDKNKKFIIGKYKSMKSDIKTLHDAIFVPEDEDEDQNDSEYVE